MKSISMRGKSIVGSVVSDKMQRTVTVEWTRRRYISKYERYELRRSKVKAHNPDEIDARVGDEVRIVETRPLSKTKHFVVVEKLSSSSNGDGSSAKESGVKKEAAKKEASAAKKAPAKKTTKKATTKKTTKKSASTATKKTD